MQQEVKLAEKIERKLPPRLVVFLQLVGRKAADRNEKAYLVGGVVRDLLLDNDNYDIDLTVEGDAVELAREMMGKDSGKITIHKQFNTAKIKWQDWNIDFVTARSEKYPKPGALPDITPGSLEEDLQRRDFTVNAMAVGLTGKDYGMLHDPCNGQRDIGGKKIRVLHDMSFIDDSTRIWRGLRYEQRLGFQLEPHTLQLLKHGIPMLDTVSGDRICYEIGCILKESFPERVFERAQCLGVLEKLNPSLKFDMRMNGRFLQARNFNPAHPPSPMIYWLLLTYDLDIENKERIISYLHLPKQAAQAMRDCSNVKDRLKLLAAPRIGNSEIYHLLCGYSLQAIVANIIAGEGKESRPALVLYTEKLHGVKPILSGSDLIKMGVAQGPMMKDILDAVLDARLDGKAVTREDEKAVIREMLSKQK
jgi:tRNA nucleotidyltransferase (CCA-adding enzyme)